MMTPSRRSAERPSAGATAINFARQILANGVVQFRREPLTLLRLHFQDPLADIPGGVPRLSEFCNLLVRDEVSRGDVMIQSLNSNPEVAWQAILEQAARVIERSLPSGKNLTKAAMQPGGARYVCPRRFANLR